MKIMLRWGEFCSSTEIKFCFSSMLLSVKLKINIMLKTFHKSAFARYCSHTSHFLFLFYNLADTFSVLIAYFSCIGTDKANLISVPKCISRIKEMRISWGLSIFHQRGLFSEAA